MPLTSKELAQRLDAEDILSSYRQRFAISDPDLIYLDGNSLGRLTLDAQERLDEVIKMEWGQRLIRSWNEGWMSAATRIGDKIAGLIGAAPGEVILADSTSVNLFKLATAALLAQPGRSKIVTDDLNFPSDLYVLDSICKLLGWGHKIEIISSTDGIHGPVDKLLEAIDHDTALLALSHTTFKSGYTYDLSFMTAAAHKWGALVLWDLSHSVGVLPIFLNDAHADLAVGCSYKYLNGGPGAPAFLYVRKDLQEHLSQPITGWMGHEQMFTFDLDYQPAPGIRGYLSGTPAILSLSAVEPAVDMILEAGISPIRDKSVRLTNFLLQLWQEMLEPAGFRLNSPWEEEHRGSHISFGHDEGHRIDMALIQEMNVIPDFREPDSIRVGLSPLYITFQEVYTAVARMRQVVVNNLYEKYEPAAGTVT